MCVRAREGFMGRGTFLLSPFSSYLFGSVTELLSMLRLFSFVLFLWYRFCVDLFFFVFPVGYLASSFFLLLLCPFFLFLFFLACRAPLFSLSFPGCSLSLRERCFAVI